MKIRFHRKCRWLTLIRYKDCENGIMRQKDKCRVCNAYRDTEAWDPRLLPPIVSRQWM